MNIDQEDAKEEADISLEKTLTCFVNANMKENAIVTGIFVTPISMVLKNKCYNCKLFVIMR
jgi:hypothetical protein